MSDRLIQLSQHPTAALKRLADELDNGWIAVIDEHDSVDAALAENGFSDARTRCLLLIRKVNAIRAGLNLLILYLGNWREAVRRSVRAAVDEAIEANPQRIMELVLSEDSHAARIAWAKEIWASVGAVVITDEEIGGHIAGVQSELREAQAEAEEAAIAYS